MPSRRILSLWFPHLGAERLLRRGFGAPDPLVPFAVVRAQGNLLSLASLSPEAARQGLRPGQPLRDAMSICPSLQTCAEDQRAEAAFLSSLRRWAGKFSPWVAEEPPHALIIDISGCAHLFGGEEALLGQIDDETAALGLSVHSGIADTVGAAWALARFGAERALPIHSGDAIDQEARATRSRAAKRRSWERGGTIPLSLPERMQNRRIAPPGHLYQSLAPLPVAALRIDQATILALAQVGLRTIGDLSGIARGALTRRFGLNLGRRLSQALGHEAEPVSPARHERNFAVRLTFPEPIGLAEDILAAIDRLLPALQERLEAEGRGARRVLLQALRTSESHQEISVGLARPTSDPARIRPLLAMKIDTIDPGFGIDAIRLEAAQSEPLHRVQIASPVVQPQGARTAGSAAGIADLLSRLGARIGLEQILRLAPGDSHIPEKAVQVLAAAWSEPAPPWPRDETGRERPLLLWRPEIVAQADGTAGSWHVPLGFRWRGTQFRTLRARGPERISPEWWLDDPEWRSGARDYWQVVTANGRKLWLFYAHGAAKSGGWFCQGEFA